MVKDLEQILSDKSQTIPIRYRERIPDGYAVVRQDERNNLKNGDGIYVIRRVIYKGKDFYELKGPFIIVAVEKDIGKKFGFYPGIIYLNSNYEPSDKFAQDLAILSTDYIAKVDGKVNYYLSNGYSPSVVYTRLTKHIPTPNHFEVYDDIGFGSYGIVPKHLVDKISDRHDFIKIMQGDYVPVILYKGNEPIATFPAVVSSSGKKIQIPFGLIDKNDISGFDNLEILIGLSSESAKKLI